VPLLGAGAAAAALAVVAVLLAHGQDDHGSSGAGQVSRSADGRSGTFSQESPWRLRIKDAISEVSGGDDVGCAVTLTSGSTGNVREWDDFYGIKTFQMRESGTFRFRVSDRGCLLLPQPGDGGVSSLPFSWSAAAGDSPVFDSAGAVSVRIGDRNGTSTCDLWLMSDSDGRPLDNREAGANQAVVRLESDGPGRVFIAAPTCSIRVSDAAR
jgi:hypothetical protein